MTSSGYVRANDGVRLYCETHGDGPAALIVPNGFYLVEALAPLVRGRRLIVFDVRNLGRSETIADPALLARGIHHDVDDIDAVRRHAGAERADLLGHSYMGLVVALYAMRHPAHVRRVVQIGAIPPDAHVSYPESAAVEARTRELMANLSALPAPAQAFTRMWLATLLPSIQQLALTPDDFARLSAPVFVVHGTEDRSAPYGGGRDWASRLPDARLLSVAGGGHAPWIDAPLVLGAVETFLDGAWPEGVEQVDGPATGTRN